MASILPASCADQDDESTQSNMTNASHDPRPSLAPMLSVRRGAQAVEFYKAAFGAKELFCVESPDGEVVAQLAIGESDFWVADESPENLNFSPPSLGGSTARMVLVVDDPDAVFAQAVAAGAKVIWPVADQSYGWRVGRVVDPYGHHWEIGKPVAKG
ncbi:MAG TPA: VOC family protein [Verrucomicrobiae bacterium]|nr:VOC family protein [Verrucomicrobiae bacterium]